MARTNEGGRLAYADLLRVMAMLAVIVLHVSGGWLESLPVGTADWHALNVWDSLCRWCVPVFVMCSGMFLLDPKKALSWPSLFLRYILRMVTALLFWGTAYRLLYELVAGTLRPASLPRVLYAVILGNTETHLWYLTMTIGLYLLTPLLRAFVRGPGGAIFTGSFWCTPSLCWSSPFSSVSVGARPSPSTPTGSISTLPWAFRPWPSWGIIWRATI